jgi:hypothetical protein
MYWIFRLLSENPSLLQLYRDLVITHVISSEEFWSQHALQYMQKQQNQKQDIGVSGAFLVCFGVLVFIYTWGIFETCGISIGRGMFCAQKQ